ncbi:fungal-specific transcription factor domain-containing protein [Phanerochaete sordida]|uniref:Fungal-specific transcription factor domain-containing protein n=1 Tax=Phanerochaete sordida TaxID=48140 RepID=A0A9P3GTD2_9APHY|nr:fungal-specific transcription factor domain-containing protein [Phanerochaete sordida]
MPVDTSKPLLSSKTRRPSKKDLDEDRQDSSHAREIELKRSRGEISCAECRRLKIRCDKTIPCKSCQRRGCAALCPNGSLATGQGTRFVLAATEHLHKRIAKMKERIRQLEDALAILQAKGSNEPHPLLRDDLLSANTEHDEEEMTEIESMPSNPPDIIDAFGTLSVSEHGVSRFFGSTGGAEYLLYNDNGAPPSDDGRSSERDSMTPPIHGELTRFSVSFPFTPIGPTDDVRRLIESHLPPWDRATHLAESYLTNAAWLFQGLTREQVVDEMLPAIYKRPRPEFKEEEIPYQDYSGPHDLALLYLVFAVGALVDLSQEPYNAEGEHYHILAKAALCLQPVLEKPSLVAIQGLYLLAVYTAMCGSDKETTMETSWSIVTLSAQLAQSIGLHRDSARWGLPAYVVERRRILFWDLFITDVWSSLTTGRPPSFSRDYVDCKFPYASDIEEGEAAETKNYDHWAPRFSLQIVAEVAERALAAEPPSYATIMELDRKVREFPVPPDVVAVVEDIKAPEEEEEPLPLSVSMGKMVMSHCREIILLWIHRSFFAQAIIDCPSNPLRSTYAASFLASYRSSVTILKTIRNQFDKYPAICSRFWTIWTYAFSAVIVFGTVVTRGPRSPLATAAVQQLDAGCELFERAAVHSRRAAKALPILHKLQEKAHAALSCVTNDPHSDGALWNIKVEDGDDELDIFAGRTRLVSSKRPSPSPACSNSEPRSAQSYIPPPPTQQFASRPQQQQQIYPPSLPSLPPLRVPETTGPGQAGPSGVKWMPPQSAQTYNSPDVYVQSHQSTPRQDVYGSASPTYPMSTYGWSGEGTPHVNQLAQQPPHHRAQYPLQTMPPTSSPYPPEMLYPAEGYAHVPPHAHAHGRAPVPSPGAYVPPPQELVNLGLVSRESRLDERWTTFMHESGYLDGLHQGGGGGNPPY